MKISKELRVGTLVGLSILIFFAGFYFLKGSNIFSSANNFYAYYDEVAGLQPSAPIQIRGLQVGKVSNIELDGKRVKITLEMKGDYPVRQGALAKLASGDLLGSKVIKLDPGIGAELAEGATIATAVEGGVIDQVSSEITPLLRTIQGVVLQVDTALRSLQGVVNEENQAHMSRAIASLDATASNFSQLSGAVNAQRGTLTKIILDAQSVTTNLKNNNAKLDRVFTNLDGMTKQLANAPIEKTFNDLQATAGNLRVTLDRINAGEGSLGALLNDKALYYRLDTTLNTFSFLADDLKKHPSRYINLTIFGKRARTAQEMGTER